MKLYNFLDSTYVGLNVELNKEYDVAKHAETMASQDLIDLMRKFIKWFKYLKLIGKFVLIKFGFIAPLKPAKQIQEEFKAKAMEEQKKLLNDRQEAIAAEQAKLKANLELVPDPTVS